MQQSNIFEGSKIFLGVLEPYFNWYEKQYFIKEFIPIISADVIKIIPSIYDNETKSIIYNMVVYHPSINQIEISIIIDNNKIYSQMRNIIISLDYDNAIDLFNKKVIEIMIGLEYENPGFEVVLDDKFNQFKKYYRSVVNSYPDSVLKVL